MRGLTASIGWGILMAAVISPALDSNYGENLAGVIAGCLIISAIFTIKE